MPKEWLFLTARSTPRQRERFEGLCAVALHYSRKVLSEFPALANITVRPVPSSEHIQRAIFR